MGGQGLSLEQILSRPASELLAIDQLPDDAGQRRAAIASVLAAESMPLPADPAELRRELDAAHDRAG